MTLAEANQMLDAAPCDGKPSRVNRFLTREQAVKIVRDAINSPIPATGKPSDPLKPIFERRVYQVAKDQLRPRYE